jgi:membrane-associated protein
MSELWNRWTRRQRAAVVLAVLLLVLCVALAVAYALTGDGFSVVDAGNPAMSYVGVFLLVTLDGIVPVFPGETTLNAASTAAANGALDLLPIIVMGALGAIVGDSSLFWIARRSGRRIQPQLRQAKQNDRVRQALELMASSVPVLIIGGRYVPGLRFVVNATMGLSDIRYRRFLLWSIISGVLWSAYTCILAFKIGQALGDFPLASVLISGLVTTVVLVLVLLIVRRRRRAVTAPAGGAE